MKEEKLLTLQQVEEMTGRKVATWRRDILNRKVDYVKIGSSVRIPLSVINNIIDKGWRKAIPAGGRPMTTEEITQARIKEAQDGG